MPAEIIDGKAIAAQIRAEVAEGVRQLQAEHGIRPGLGVVLVGDNPASRKYVSSKEKACEQVGIFSREANLPSAASQDEVLAHVEEYNRDPAIHGILVQLPLPEQVDGQVVLDRVSPRKDVDGFHPHNLGTLVSTNDAPFIACTPLGCIELLKRSGVTIKGAHAVVVGRSTIVGKPVALLLLREHATVTICHSRTRDLGAVTRQADILVAAVGKARLITGEMVKPGATVIDVGINFEDGKLVGDVDFDSAVEVAGKITPVPGGVGPMTIAMLLSNTLKSARAFAVHP